MDSEEITVWNDNFLIIAVKYKEYQTVPFIVKIKVILLLIYTLGM